MARMWFRVHVVVSMCRRMFYGMVQDCEAMSTGCAAGMSDAS